MTCTLADWLDRIERQHPASIAMGLERVRAVATHMRLAHPAQHVITVAGTNGKGSTVAFIEAIALAQGLRVGTYTSPHLHRYNERVRIDGSAVDDALLVQGFEAVEAARGDVPLTYFEYGTLCALWLFQREPLDIVVLEVGLGGRLDAVNVVDADAAIITTVDFDHQDWLGNDIDSIGMEKAGVARAGKPLVLGDDDPPASVLRHAYAIGASTWRIANDFFAEPLDAEQWCWRDVGCSIQLPMPMRGMAAPVQLRNAACAVAALRSLPVHIDAQAYQAGIASAAIAGRLQSIDADGVEVLVDVGHNPQAARSLAAWLQAHAGKHTLVVYAALADKDVDQVTQALAADVQQWFLAGTEAAGARGTTAANLAARLQGNAAAGQQFADVQIALQTALKTAQAGQRILVFGSFHAAVEALKFFGKTS